MLVWEIKNKISVVREDCVPSTEVNHSCVGYAPFQRSPPLNHSKYQSSTSV